MDGKHTVKCSGHTSDLVYNGNSCRESYASRIFPLKVCHEYKTSKTSRGDWYLPSAGEMGCVIQNLLLINNQITKEKGVEYQINTSGDEYWTSTPNWMKNHNEPYCWAVDFEHGRIHKKDRSKHSRVRPFLQINY